MLRTSSLLVFAVLLFALVFGQDHHGGEDSPAGRYSAKAEAKAQNLTAEIRLKLEVGQGVNSVRKNGKLISCVLRRCQLCTPSVSSCIKDGRS